jgi:hypothetical protein
LIDRVIEVEQGGRHDDLMCVCMCTCLYVEMCVWYEYTSKVYVCVGVWREIESVRSLTVKIVLNLQDGGEKRSSRVPARRYLSTGVHIFHMSRIDLTKTVEKTMPKPQFLLSHSREKNDQFESSRSSKERRQGTTRFHWPETLKIRPIPL